MQDDKTEKQSKSLTSASGTTSSKPHPPLRLVIAAKKHLRKWIPTQKAKFFGNPTLDVDIASVPLVTEAEYCNMDALKRSFFDSLKPDKEVAVCLQYALAVRITSSERLGCTKPVVDIRIDDKVDSSSFVQWVRLSFVLLLVQPNFRAVLISRTVLCAPSPLTPLHWPYTPPSGVNYCVSNCASSYIRICGSLCVCSNQEQLGNATCCITTMACTKLTFPTNSFQRVSSRGFPSGSPRKNFHILTAMVVSMSSAMTLSSKTGCLRWITFRGCWTLWKPTLDGQKQTPFVLRADGSEVTAGVSSRWDCREHWSRSIVPNPCV